MLKKKHLVPVAVAFLVAGLLAGCAGAGKKGKEIEKLLEDKYGEKFRVTSVSHSRTYKGEGYYEAEAYAVKHKDLVFSLNMDEDGSTFSDGYVMKRGTALVADKIRDNIGRMKNPCYVHVQSMFPDALTDDPDQTLEEYLQQENTNFYTVYLYINPKDETPESIWEHVEHALDGMPSMNGSMEIFFSDKATMKKAQGYVESHAGLEDEYMKIGENDHVYGIDFQSGTIGTAKSAFLDAAEQKMR